MRISLNLAQTLYYLYHVTRVYCFVTVRDFGDFFGHIVRIVTVEAARLYNCNSLFYSIKIVDKDLLPFRIIITICFGVSDCSIHF